MKYLFIVFLLALFGCSTPAPITKKFPEAPKTLITSCPQLNKLEKTDPLLSEVIKSVVENYTLYHECALKNDAWIEWYNTQRKIFEDKK